MTDVLGWLKRWGNEADLEQKAALAARLRRELVDYEARLEQAAGILQAARDEERDAGLALAGREVVANCNDAESRRVNHTPTQPQASKVPNSAPSRPDPRHLEAARRRLTHAQKTRELAWLGFQVARSRVNLHSGVIRRLEQELSEDEGPLTASGAVSGP